MNYSSQLVNELENTGAMVQDTHCNQRVSSFVKYAGTPIIILGLIGNILSMMVFSRKALRSRSCSMYFLALSFSDINVLLGYTLENLLYHAYSIQVLSNSLMCKSVIFLIYASTDISNYLLTLAAIDRCVLIGEFRFRSRFCRKSTATYLIVFVVIFFSLISSHILFGFDVDKTGACVPISKNYIAFYVNHYDSYIDILKTVLIPFIFIFCCNLFIILTLARRRSSVNRSDIFQRKNQRRREKDRQLTWFLLLSSILFIILSLPAEINDFIRTRLPQDFQAKYTCQLWACTSLLILIQQSNHASHFYVYTLTGPIFREEFLKLICFCKKFSKSNGTRKRLKMANPTEEVIPLSTTHQLSTANKPKEVIEAVKRKEKDQAVVSAFNGKTKNLFLTIDFNCSLD